MSFTKASYTLPNLVLKQKIGRVEILPTGQHFMPPKASVVPQAKKGQKEIAGQEEKGTLVNQAPPENKASPGQKESVGQEDLPGLPANARKVAAHVDDECFMMILMTLRTKTKPGIINSSFSILRTK